jgi:hypothetical protein
MACYSQEWVKAEEHGRQLREWKGYIGLDVERWASEDMESWVDERLAQADDHGLQLTNSQLPAARVSPLSQVRRTTFTAASAGYAKHMQG